MTTNRLAWVGWTICAAGISLIALSITVAVLDDAGGVQIGQELGFAVFGFVGAVVFARQPGNRLGWTFLATVVAAGLQGCGENYGSYGMAHDLPGWQVAAWLQSWAWIVGWAVPLVFATLLFPDGRPLSRVFDRVTRVALGAVISFVVAFGIGATFVPADQLMAGNLDTHEFVQQVAVYVAFSSFVVLLGCGLAGFVSLVLRFRRSRSVERQQLKVALAAATAALALNVGGQFAGSAGTVMELAGSVLLPIGVAVAILRYRLYDIDRVISRTVSWALVTAVLVGVYVGVVAVAGAALPGSSGSFAVAIATLVAAALLHPVRRRIQGGVDRRFNRARYDAQRTVAAFAVRVRNEVDLDEVRTDLLATVAATVQPGAAALSLLPASTTARPG